MDQNNKKLGTNIHGLDNLFHGGLHLEKIGDKEPNLMIVIRGEHGTNKIHLAMQMCEGLNRSIDDEGRNSNINNNKNGNASNKKHGSKTLSRDDSSEKISPFEHVKKLIEDRIEIKSRRLNKAHLKQNNWKGLLDNRILSAIAQKAIIMQKGSDNQRINIFTKIEPNDPIIKCLDSLIKEYSLDSVDTILKDLEGSELPQDNFGNGGMLFVSLNKDDEKIKEFYYDFYVKRLITNIQIKAEGWHNEKEEGKSQKDDDIFRIKGLFRLPNDVKENKELLTAVSSEPLLSVVKFLSSGDEIDEKDLRNVFASGILYYNTRTHGLHIRQQTKNDDSNNTQLLTIDYNSSKIPKITFWGRTKLSANNEMADNRTVFFNLVQELEKEETEHYNCIMIDGLSLLTQEESEDCPINALIDLLRKKCTVGILNTNNNQPVSKLDSDIIIDLRNRIDDTTNHTKKELRIYKCLYQKNVYGWHQYKMRNAGVEVIPSLHKTLSRRNYIDESITEAMLPLNDMSYNYWINENIGSKDPKEQDNKRSEIISELAKNYNDFYKSKTNKTIYEEINQGKLIALTSFENEKYAIYRALKEISNVDDHVLFIDLKRSRKDFWEFIGKEFEKEEIPYHNLHYFGFRAGCIYADEFLYVIEQQVAAIARGIMDKEKEEAKKEKDNQTKKQIFHYYKKVHIIMGDLNLLQYCYPCLYSELLFIPTFSALTKGNYMTNFIYMTKGDNSKGSLRTRRQLTAIADETM